MWIIDAPRVKIIIEYGIVSAILCDTDIDAEIIDVDGNYDDYEKTKQYRDELLNDSTLKEQELTFARFPEEN